MNNKLLSLPGSAAHELICCVILNESKWSLNVKGTQSAMGPRWPGNYFCQFEKRLHQSEIKSTCRIHHPLQSYLAFHSILDLLLKISFWANFYSSYYIILSYLVKNTIQRNMNRRGEKRVGGRVGEIAFVYQNIKRNDQNQ